MLIYSNVVKVTFSYQYKEDLVDRYICLQENYLRQVSLNEHIFKTVNTCMQNNLEFSNEMGKVLEVWNASGGTSYVEK